MLSKSCEFESYLRLLKKRYISTERVQRPGRTHHGRSKQGEERLMANRNEFPFQDIHVTNTSLPLPPPPFLTLPYRFQDNVAGKQQLISAPRIPEFLLWSAATTRHSLTVLLARTCCVRPQLLPWLTPQPRRKCRSTTGFHSSAYRLGVRRVYTRSMVDRLWNGWNRGRTAITRRY